MKKCMMPDCENLGKLVEFSDQQIYLCDRCRLHLFKALLRENVPTAIKSKFKI